MKSLIFMLFLSLGSFSALGLGQNPECGSPEAEQSKCDCVKTTADGVSRTFTYDPATEAFVPKIKSKEGDET